MTLYVLKDKSGAEIITNDIRFSSDTIEIAFNGFQQMMILPKGSIKKLTGVELSCDDEPIQLN